MFYIARQIALSIVTTVTTTPQPAPRR